MSLDHGALLWFGMMFSCDVYALVVLKCCVCRDAQPAASPAQVQPRQVTTGPDVSIRSFTRENFNDNSLKKHNVRTSACTCETRHNWTSVISHSIVATACNDHCPSGNTNTPWATVWICNLIVVLIEDLS